MHLKNVYEQFIICGLFSVLCIWFLFLLLSKNATQFQISTKPQTYVKVQLFILSWFNMLFIFCAKCIWLNGSQFFSQIKSRWNELDAGIFSIDFRIFLKIICYSITILTLHSCIQLNMWIISHCWPSTQWKFWSVSPFATTAQRSPSSIGVVHFVAVDEWNVITKNVIIYALIIRCRRFKVVKYPMVWRQSGMKWLTMKCVVSCDLNFSVQWSSTFIIYLSKQ